MRTVPAHLAELAAGSAVAEHGVRLGAAVEVDLESLAEADPTAAAAVEVYLRRVDTLEEGAYIAVAIPVLSARQQDTRAGRADLTAQLEALENSEIGDIVLALCSASPDPEQLTLLGAPWQLEREETGELRSVARLTVAGRRAWSVHLGGAASSREVARRFTLTISHAAWRDRRSRRLVALDVHSIEILPDPHSR